MSSEGLKRPYPIRLLNGADIFFVLFLLLVLTHHKQSGNISNIKDTQGRFQPMPAMAKRERETHNMKLLNTAQYEIIKKNWHKFMSGPLLTWEEFIAETEEEQDKFFKWFCKQYNDTFTISI